MVRRGSTYPLYQLLFAFLFYVTTVLFVVVLISVPPGPLRQTMLPFDKRSLRGCRLFTMRVVHAGAPSLPRFLPSRRVRAWNVPANAADDLSVNGADLKRLPT